MVIAVIPGAAWSSEFGQGMFIEGTTEKTAHVAPARFIPGVPTRPDSNK